MISLYEKSFNEKVDSFKNHIEYARLRAQADEALRLHTGVGPEAMCAGDFMDRIVAMPESYIRDWLDGLNNLEWRCLDKLALRAFKGGYMELQAQYPDVDIHRISPGAFEFYQSLGFVVLHKTEDICFVAKANQLQGYEHNKSVDEIVASAVERVGNGQSKDVDDKELI